MKSTRSEERTEARGGVLYTVTSHDSEEKIYSGLIDNISDSGACIYVQEHLEDSESIKVFFREISSAPKEAQVIWCTRESNNLFKVGVRLEGQA